MLKRGIIGVSPPDGETRITVAPGVTLLGGTEESHSRMQEITTKVSEDLSRKGRRIEDTPIRELQQRISEASEKIG